MFISPKKDKMGLYGSVKGIIRRGGTTFIFLSTRTNFSWPDLKNM